MRAVRVCEGKRTGGEDDKGRHGEHDKGVDEHADHRDDALIARVLDLGQRVSMRGRAHTSFVGEQAACHTKPDRLADRDAGHAARHRLRIKGEDEDLRKGRTEVPPINGKYDERAEDIQDSHHRHDLFRHSGDALLAAEEDDRRENGHDNAYSETRHVESGLERVTDGVRLHHVAHEKPRARVIATAKKPARNLPNTP